jgi:small subunit ribosomal protein S17
MEEINTPNEVSASETAPVSDTVSTAAARGRRAEKIGIVASDKMQKTVVVRVDRLVKHPTYKRYVRRRTKFMAHNEIEGVSTGDQVRIVETRPLSARKRWRVVEVLRKASK